MTAVRVAGAAPTADAVTVSGLFAGYEGRVAVEDLSFSIPAGRLLAIFGPNGGGKSTLLKVLAGIQQPVAGSVRILGAAPGVAARRVAYVPQAELVDWAFPVTVRDVVMMGRYPRLGPVRRPRREDHEAVDAALERVGMSDFGRVQIGALSGGQRRRVFLARAFAAGPDLYLLDEPVTGVDATTQEDLMDLLEAEAASGKTVVATTHDLACAAQRFSDVLALNRRLVAHGPAPIVLDREVLSRTYGGHLLVLNGQTIVLDDAHHHDQAPHGERHHHEDGRS